MALDTGFPAGMTVYFNGVYNDNSTSFRHGLPESRLQGRIKLTIPGTGYQLPGRYDEFCFFQFSSAYYLLTTTHGCQLKALQIQGLTFRPLSAFRRAVSKSERLS